MGSSVQRPVATRYQVLRLHGRVGSVHFHQGAAVRHAERSGRAVRHFCSVPGVATLRVAVCGFYSDQYPAAARGGRILLDRAILRSPISGLSVVRVGRSSTPSSRLDRLVYGCAGSQCGPLLYLARDVLAVSGKGDRPTRRATSKNPNKVSELCGFCAPSSRTTREEPSI